METFTKFLYDFLGQFFSGIRIIFQGLGKGLILTLYKSTKATSQCQNGYW